ncbi:kinase-like domain-containing protein, partial [Cladorrhinum sp. PSN332]
NLRSRLVTAKVKNEEGQFFIPVDVVSRLVTTSTIRDELLASSLDTNTLSDPDGFIQHVSESAKKVFAILALIGRVVDITVFTLAGIRDHNLPLKIDALKSLTSNFKQTFDDFYGTQWQVLTPYFTTIPSEIYHYELEDNVVLPFINDPSIQRSEMIRGGFGTVCRTQIHAGQYSESWGQRRDQSTFVAVKEIPASNRKAFEREVSNLRMVSRLEASDHLIKLKASVRHKGSYYLVFDWAGGGNLRDLWQSKAPTVRNAPSQKWMLEQLTGLAKGLAQLHSYTPGGRGEPGGTFRHGDIKPENILFFKNSDSPQNTGKLVLADFGLGRLRADDNRPRRLQGTPTYRAPECDLPEGKISKAYDIWSFGCVILELLIWYMEGSTMLDEFAAARSQSMSFRTPFRKRLARTSLETERNLLFVRANLLGCIIKWIKRLREHPRCSDVLSDLIDLIEYRMLVTDPGQRIDSRSFSTELGAMAARLLRNPEYGQSPRPTEQEEASSTSGDVNAKAQVQDSWKSHPETPIPTYAPLANMRIMYGQPSCWPFRRIFDGLRRWAEQGLNTKVDWWPLPAIHPELAATEVMLIWEYGGRKMSIVADRAEAERLLKSEVQVNKSSSPVEIPATAKPPVSKRIHQALLTALWICLSKSQVNTSPGQSPQVPVKINPWKETYLCVDRCWTSATETRLSTLDSIDTMTDDSDFFREARRVLGQARGTRFQRFLSWRAYTHVDLSQFHFLFDNNTLVKTFSCASLTKTPICQGYDYNCSQATDIDIHMSIISEIILHGIRSPDLGKGQKTVLDGIPKRKAPPELPKKAKESGWGFHTGQGPSLRKVISWFLGILFFAVGFVPIWLASINKIDLQNAFAPGTFLVTVFAIIVACYAVMEGVS